MSDEEHHEHDGWFINEETGQEINVQYDSGFVFITEYRDNKPKVKFVFDMATRSTEEIVAIIKAYGIVP